MTGETEAAASAAGEGSRLYGYIHAGGILNDALLGRQDPSYVRQVYAPKHSGAVNIVQVGYLSSWVPGPRFHRTPAKRSEESVRECQSLTDAGSVLGDK